MTHKRVGRQARELVFDCCCGDCQTLTQLVTLSLFMSSITHVTATSHPLDPLFSSLSGSRYHPHSSTLRLSLSLSLNNKYHMSHYISLT